MRYILVRLNYVTGVTWWFIISYNEQTCEVKRIGGGTEYDRNTHYDYHIGIADFNDCSIFSTMFKASFEQVTEMLYVYCNKRFEGDSTIDYVIQEIPKKKAFELML